MAEDKIKFTGDIKGIEPERLINLSEHERFDSFFLSIGIIFNDLKGLILFNKLFFDKFIKPEGDGVSDHLGNYNGISLHISKLLTSVLNEFFIFLKKYNDIYNSYKFKAIINNFPSEYKNLWPKIIAAANGHSRGNIDQFLKVIVRVRSNVAYHYDHKGKVIWRSFKSRFSGKWKNKESEKAFYSIGDTVELTRFYFSDAAVQECIFNETNKNKYDDVDIIVESVDKYNKTILVSVDLITNMLRLFMKYFIQYKRNLPK